MSMPTKKSMEKEIYHSLMNDNFTVPNIILKHYQEMGMTKDDVFGILIIYGAHPNSQMSFSLQNLLNYFDGDEIRAREILAGLNQNKLVARIDENENYSLSPFYDRLFDLFMFLKINKGNKKRTGKKKTANLEVVAKFEEAFARPIKNIEIDKIDFWLNSKKYQAELVIESLARAVIYGAVNFAYIEKILITWEMEGVKSVQDLFEESNEKQAPIKVKKSTTKQVTKKGTPAPMVADGNDFDLVLR